MSLRDAINDQAVSTLPSDQVLTEGDKLNWVVSSSSERWTYDGVADRWGVVVAESLGQAIQGAGLQFASLTYAGKGIDLSQDQTQVQLTALADAVPALASVCNALKLIGRTVGTLWQFSGIDRPTADQIDAERSQQANEAWAKQITFDVIPAALAARKTRQQILDAITAS